MRRYLPAVTLALALVVGCKRGDKSETDVFGSGPLPGAQAEGKEPIALPSGLKYIDLQEGIGDSPKDGQRVFVHYRAFLPDGKEFDSSRKTGQHVWFRLEESAKVMPAWIEGIRTMKPGGKRKLIVPPALAFGEGGRPPIVPPKTPVVVDLELLKAVTIKPPPLRLPPGQTQPVIKRPARAGTRQKPAATAPTSGS